MKLQACTFNRKVSRKNAKTTKVSTKVERGIAKVNFGFGCHDIEWIIDKEGKIVVNLYDYKLLEGPLKYMDTEIVS